MDQQGIKQLLDRYLSGEASEAEKKQVEAWFEDTGGPNPDWEQMSKSERGQWMGELYADIGRHLHPEKTRVISIGRAKKTGRSMAAIAAMLAVFLTVYFQWPAIQHRLHPVQLTVLKTSIDQQQQITLADGSTIQLNSGSELKYPKKFDGRTREVYLSGEAYFDIRHDAAKPFIIHTGKVVTTVLGTAFNIKEDPGKKTITVTVTRGKVSVAEGGTLLGVITPNQQISFNTQDRKAECQQVDAQQVIAWQQGDLRFEDISFAEAAVQLEQRFHVKIRFANENLRRCRFSGTSLKGEKLDQLLKVLCTFNKATYQTLPDGAILIDGPGCN